MKLRSLAVNQFKKFTSPVKLGGIEDGLNVVVGPNEMGKSTLLDALRAVLFEKYDSKAGTIRELQNKRNEAAPVVELTFELENGLHSISKRFLKRSYARLRCPDGSMHEGTAAENRLRDLLNFSESGRSAANSEALGMLNVLWVKQGQSFGALNLPASARADLHGALESEVGTVLGGRRGRKLPQTIEKRLGELVTQTGRSRGEYKTATQQVASLEKKIEELEEKRRNLSDTLKDLEESQEKLERLSDSGRDQADKARLDEARRRLNELAELENRMKTAESELEVRKLRLERTEEKKKQRHDLGSDIDKEKTTLEKLREEHKEFQELEEQTRMNLEELRKKEGEAETAAQEADDVVLPKSRILAAVELKTSIRSRSTQLEKAREAEKRKLEAQNRAAAISVTKEIIGQVTAAEKEVEKAVNRLDATSTLIAFDMENPAGIEVDGMPLTSGKDSLQTVSPTTITIPERGKIMVEPAAKNRDELLNQRHEAENRLKDILNEIGVSTVGEAEILYSEREEAFKKAEFARQEAELYAPRTDEHEGGAQALADYIKKHQQILEKEMDKLTLRELPERQEAETALQNARDAAETARHVLNKARADLEGPREILTNLEKKLVLAEERCEEGEKRLDNLLNQLEKAENECTEDKLREETKAARKAVADQEATVEKLRAKQGEDDTLEQVEARVKRLEKAIENKRREYHELEIRIVGLKKHVDLLEGAGLDEDIGKEKRELELREEERKRYEREAKVLGLLLKTLRDAEQEAKELYLSPVTNRMRPYLRLLFPGSDITIDEDLRITGVIREAGYEEPFPLLSMGTQEQVAVLVRLAFAEMLAEQGRPATVVLDDALVFSDDARMNRMFDILNFASRKVQILIFTCREQLFEDIGGHLLSLRPGDLEELMSA